MKRARIRFNSLDFVIAKALCLHDWLYVHVRQVHVRHVHARHLHVRQRPPLILLPFGEFCSFRLLFFEDGIS